MVDATDVSEVVAQEQDNHERKTERENLIALRKKAEQLEMEKTWYQQQMQQMQQQYAPKAAPIEEDDFDFKSLEQENFPDGKQLNKAFNSVAKKLQKMEQTLSAKDQKLSIMETAMATPDFLQVCTDENIKKYILSDEDLSSTVKFAKNPGRMMYNLIRKNTEYQEEQKAKAVPKVSQEQKKVDEKEQKPRTSSIGVRSEAVTSAAKFSQLSKQDKAALWAETQKFARR